MNLIAHKIPCTLRDLTVDIGSDNPLASGILTSQQHSFRNVDFRSSDSQKAGRAAVHVRDTAEMIVMSHVDIDGFDVGVSSGYSASIVAAEHLAAASSKVPRAFVEDLDLTAIRGLTSQQMKSPSVRRRRLVNSVSRKKGGTWEASPKQRSTGRARCTDGKIATEGYLRSLKIDRELDSGASVDEYIQKFQDPAAAPKTGFTLPFEETPDLPTAGKWVSAKAYGAKGDGETDDTAAIQRAIDAGAPIVYFPRGDYRIDGVVKLRGSLQRPCGMSSAVGVGARAGSVFRLEDGKPTTVTSNGCSGQRKGSRSRRTCFAAHLCAAAPVSARGELYRSTIADPRLFLEDVNAPGSTLQEEARYSAEASVI